MLLIAVRKGGVKCSSACPYYAEKGQVKGVRGVPLKTHCRATMQDVVVDCDVWNPNKIEKLEVSEEEWNTFQKMLGRKAMKERKPYDPDHKEIHPVGYNWKHRFSNNRSSLKNEIRTGASQPCGDKWNAKKSSNVKK